MFEVAYDWFNCDRNDYILMNQWFDENVHEEYTKHLLYCDAYCFEKEEDAIAFKLRWG